jgi:hypothetical protein
MTAANSKNCCDHSSLVERCPNHGSNLCNCLCSTLNSTCQCVAPNAKRKWEKSFWTWKESIAYYATSKVKEWQSRQATTLTLFVCSGRWSVSRKSRSSGSKILCYTRTPTSMQPDWTPLDPGHITDSKEASTHSHLLAELSSIHTTIQWLLSIHTTLHIIYLLMHSHTILSTTPTPGVIIIE